MATDQDWPYDAIRDDPLTALRIPVISGVNPDHGYMIALVVRDERLWPGLRPTDEEARMLTGFCERWAEFMLGPVSRRQPGPFDVGALNTFTFRKRGDDDWCYRQPTWDRGPFWQPVPLDAEGGSKLSLAALLDRIGVPGGVR